MMRVLAARRVAALVGAFPRDPAYKGLAEALRVLITDGRVPVGVRLPSERELTEALDVSRTTVTRAYAELREHGYVVSRQGSGTVASLPSTPGLRSDHLLPPGDLPEDKIDLTCAAPLAGPGILAAYEKAVGELPAYLAGTGYYPSGLPVLREAVAASYDARGLPTDPDQVMVVPGALAGVSIVARALLDAGARAVVESPTYPNAIASLRHTGARIVGADVGAGDGDVAELAAAVQQVRPRIAYVIPDFHNPTGHLLDDDGRAHLATVLRNTGTIGLVDESMAQLGLHVDRMPAPLAAHAPGAISVGSLSKPFWGGLRVGWVRAPEHLMDRLFRARLSLDLGVPLLEQLVATELLHHGDGLLEHRRDQLRSSRDAALVAVATHLPEWRAGRPLGGLQLWCELPEALSSALVPHAARQDVLIAAGPSFAPEGGLDRFVRIPFTQPAHVLAAAVERLGRAWQETLADRGNLRHGGHGRRTGPTLVA
jgi:DNA-binding transcriptional MocR family regulator